MIYHDISYSHMLHHDTGAGDENAHLHKVEARGSRPPPPRFNVDQKLRTRVYQHERFHHIGSQPGSRINIESGGSGGVLAVLSHFEVSVFITRPGIESLCGLVEILFLGDRAYPLGSFIREGSHSKRWGGRGGRGAGGEPTCRGA